MPKLRSPRRPFVVLLTLGLAPLACKVESLPTADESPGGSAGASGAVASMGATGGSAGSVTPTDGSAGSATPTGGSAGSATPTGGSAGSATPTGGSAGSATPTGGSAGSATPTGGSAGSATPTGGSTPEGGAGGSAASAAGAGGEPASAGAAGGLASSGGSSQSGGAASAGGGAGGQGGSGEPLGGTGGSAATCSWWRSGRVASWTAATDLPSDLRALVVDPAVPATVYAAGAGVGVFKSTDRGATFTGSATGLPGSVVQSLVVCGSDSAELCAAAGNSLYASDDGAESWTLRASDITSSSGGFDHLLTIEGDPETLFGKSWDFVQRSDTSGSGWVDADAGLPTDAFLNVLASDLDDPDTVYVGTGFGFDGLGVFRTNDRGASWTAANAGILDAHVGALLDSPHGLYAGGGSLLYRSEDGATTWENLSARLPAAPYPEDVVAFARHPDLPDTLFVLRGSFQVEATCDGGASFQTLVARPTPSVSVTFEAPALTTLWNGDELVLLAGTADGGGFRAVLQ